MPSSDHYQNEALGGQKFVPNNVWASQPSAQAEQELTLPSGQTCLARKMGVEGVIETGLLAQVDVLTATVDQYSRKVKGGNGVPDGQAIDNSLLKDPKAMSAIIGLVDRLLPHIVVSPPVKLHFLETKVGSTVVTRKIAPEHREDGVVYSDQIELDDKMELFNWAMGGLEKFTSFRRKADGDVGTVGDVAKSPKPSKRRPRNR